MYKLIFTFIVVLNACFLYAQKEDFYAHAKEIMKETRAIQKLKYNQDKPHLLTQNGAILLAEVLPYNTKSTGFRVYKFNIKGEIDTTFGQQGVAEQTLPEAYYKASDIIEAANGNIYVAGAKKEKEHGLGAESIIIKYTKAGKIDTTFAEKGVFSYDFGTYYDLAATKIMLNAASEITMLNKTIGNDYEDKISIVRLLYDGQKIMSKYVDTKTDSEYRFLTPIAGIFGGENMHELANGSTAVVGIYAASYKERKKQFGFVLMYDKSLKIDSSFAKNGVLLIDIDSTYFKSIDDFVELDDHKLLLLGTTRRDKVMDSADAKVFLLRIDEKGAIDRDFGKNGKAVFSEKDVNDYGEKIARFSDGTFLVAYHSNGKSRPFTHKYFVHFDKNGRVLADKNFDFYPYQFRTNFNFPYQAVFEEIIIDYNAMLRR